MDKKQNSKIPGPEFVILDLVSSALNQKTNEVESLALILSRLVRKDNPDFSKRLSHLLSSFSIGASSIRGVESPIPTDIDSHLEMVTVLPPNKDIHLEPILNEELRERVNIFLEERARAALLLEKGLTPSTSLLLIGPPGTGKTMLARYIASCIGKHLVVLDLSSSISSLLGKTGQNLKRVLQYARQTGSVLLLDEFDAIAKKRDDSTDLGEIKRVVNVLLMELESWPPSGVVIATSNHPELLDRAIWRRFDHILEIDHPEKEERIQILQQKFGNFLDERAHLIPLIAEFLKKKSPADISKYAENVKRRVVLKEEDPAVACVHELELQTGDKKLRGEFCVLAKRILGDRITVRELAEITGLSPAGVQHHLSKNEV